MRSLNYTSLKALDLLFLDKGSIAQPAKSDLNKKSFPKQKTVQNFTIDAQVFRRTENENPLAQEMGVTSQPVPANLPTMGRSAGTG